MTGQTILDKFHNFVSDELDTDFELELANDAMHEIEEEVQPEFLKKTSTSASTTVGQTYTTGIALPADFYAPCNEIYVGTDMYTQVPFEKATEYRNIPNHFYINHAALTYHLTGTQNSVQVISFPYFYGTTDITVSTSPVWPARFHSLIPLKMAQMYYAIDQGEKGRAWDDRYLMFYEKRLSRFKDYDTSLKLASVNHTAVMNDSSSASENRIN